MTACLGVGFFRKVILKGLSEEVTLEVSPKREGFVDPSVFSTPSWCFYYLSCLTHHFVKHIYVLQWCLVNV